MKNIRSVLLQLHLWTGLCLGVLFIVLGLSGSAIVYPSLFSNGPSVPNAGIGESKSLEAQIAVARDANPSLAGMQATLVFPDGIGRPSIVSFARERSGDGRGRRSGRRDLGDRAGNGDGERAEGRGNGSEQIYVDPSNLKIVGVGTSRPSPLLRLAHQIHESLLLGRQGRIVVGCLGIAMTLLGLTGLILWWPKRGQWKAAFLIRRNASGARLYREIHGAFGIWFYLVFITVSVTGAAIAFPNFSQLLGNQSRGAPTRPELDRQQPNSISVPSGGFALPYQEVVAGAEHLSGMTATGIVVSSLSDRPISVLFSSPGVRPTAIVMNQFTGEAIGLTKIPQPGLTLRGLHEGRGLGPVYRLAVFLSGFLPVLFVTTGFLLWLKKRSVKVAPKPTSNFSTISAE